MTGNDYNLGKDIGATEQKTKDLDTRLTDIEKKVDEILSVVNQWKGMIVVYSGLAAIAVTIVIKCIWK